MKKGLGGGFSLKKSLDEGSITQKATEVVAKPTAKKPVQPITKSTPKPVIEEPKSVVVEQKPVSKNTSKIGLQPGWVRASFIIREEFSEKLERIKYHKGNTIKELVNKALYDFLADIDVPEIPKKAPLDVNF